MITQINKLVKQRNKLILILILIKHTKAFYMQSIMLINNSDVIIIML